MIVLPLIIPFRTSLDHKKLAAVGKRFCNMRGYIYALCRKLLKLTEALEEPFLYFCLG